MTKQSKIHNLAELKAEITRLKVLKNEQEAYLKSQMTLLNHKIETPMRIFNVVKSNVPGLNMITGLFSPAKNSGGTDSDWLTKVLRIGVPFVMNRFFFKKASVLKKALLLLASEKALGQVNQDSITGIIAKVTDFIKPKKNKKRKGTIGTPPVVEDQVNEYGIPSYSETY
ncbi:hypothetical protein SF1_00750 [Sphingobacterium faecium NBRC 15299]|jgi:hypothetical protein|uniref:hypothetical protein n=1 Tax=Sphingobacterium faecium TaxID=34087 RepID=UPI000D3D8ADE|nr:hypothetical protein [Sphingobacterium faecium]PTX12385.1 hypothetical protein C8N37_10279 [Sphingobacterium faecium]UZJ65349.1 hypothetical protein OKW96_03870 [Sphingobacterium sp. KU25419]GEM62093.1 hypothetical protein SF1_00750 [Sphingobacterium faecium NBRC 15299]